MKRILSALIILTILSISSLYAKTVSILMFDGTEMKGKLIEANDTFVRIRTVAGIKKYYRSAIKKIRLIETPAEALARMIKKNPPKTAEDHNKLADWCKKQRLLSKYFHHFREAVKIDPKNEKANRGLGRVPYEKKWIDKDGKVQTEILWVSGKEKKRLILDEKKRAEEMKAKNAANIGNITKKKTDGKKKDDDEDSMKLFDWQHNFFMKYIPDLASGDWKRREIAIKTLITQKFSNKVPPLLLEVIKTGPELARLSALDALARMKYPDAVRICEERALQDESAEVRRQAVFGLGEIGGASSVRVLLKALKDKDEEVVREAIASMEKITFVTYDYLSTVNVSAVTKIFTKWYRANAGKAREEILYSVIGGAGRGMDKVSACKMLYKLGNKDDAISSLIDLLLNDDVQTQVEANNSLIRLTGEDFEFEPFTTSKLFKTRWQTKWRKWHAAEMNIGKPVVAETAKRGKGPEIPETPKVTGSDAFFKAILVGGKQKDAAGKDILAMDKIRSVSICIRGLNHENFFVRATCFGLLQKLTNYEVVFGYDSGEDTETIRLKFIAKWDEWFAQNKHNLK